MTSNLPILYQNVMDGLPSENARRAFLWAVDKFPADRQCYQAEAFAREAGQLADDIGGLISMASEQHRKQGRSISSTGIADLRQFFADRHANFRVKGNLKTEYLVQQ